MSPGSSKPPQSKTLFAGVHLAGPNTVKTALVVLEGSARAGSSGVDRSPADDPLKILKVYEKIGSFGTLFSDERLAQILTHEGPFDEVFVDCPLTLPPCVACQRPQCPGAVKCDDVSVAYMLKVSDRLRRRGARKARPVNPQSQRLWDVMQLEKQEQPRLEPSYSANLAPLVARAMTLQRRLNGLGHRIELRETVVPSSLELLKDALGLPEDVRTAYRRFEDGRDIRVEIVTQMIDAGLIDIPQDSVLEQLTSSVEVFHSFFSAWVAGQYYIGRTEPRPVAFVQGEGWVHLPTLLSGDLEP